MKPPLQQGESRVLNKVRTQQRNEGIISRDQDCEVKILLTTTIG